MTLLKRISGVFKPESSEATRKTATHRERLRQRPGSDKAPSDDDITAQFATAFEALDRTASGTELVKEICADLTDESEKLKRSLIPKKAHE